MTGLILVLFKQLKSSQNSSKHGGCSPETSLFIARARVEESFDTIMKREEDIDELDIPSVPPSPFPSAPEPSRRDKRKRDGDGEVSESKRSRPNPKSRKRSRDADDEGNARKRFREDEPYFDEIPEPSIARPNKRPAKNQLKRPNKKQDIGELEEEGRPTRNRRAPQRYDPVVGKGYGGASTHSRFL